MKANYLRISIMILGFTFSFCPTEAQTWNNVSTPQMGNGQSFCVHNNALFIATSAGGPHKTTDGKSWIQKKEGLDGKGIQGAGLDVLDSWIYYGSKGDIHRSSDGEKWDTVGTGIDITANNFVRWFYLFDGTYFCVMSAAITNGGGIYSSSDGKNWTLSSDGMATNNTCLQMTKIGNKLYVGTNLDFFESSDNGKTWTSALPGKRMLHNGLTTFKNRWLLFTTTGVIFSDDQGANWKESADDPRGTIQCGFIEGQNDTLFSWAASSGVYYSLDTGSTWTDYSGDLTNNDKLFMQEVALFKNSLYLSTLLAIKTNASGNGSSNILKISPTNSLTIYPNPATNKVYVEIPALREDVIISVVDVLGLTKQQFETNATRSELNLSELSPGIYYIRVSDVTTNKSVAISRIVKN